MALGAPDESGRPRPVPINGSEFIVPVDTVIAAIGQVPEVDFVKEAGSRLNKGRDRRSHLRARPPAIEGVFAGGDSAGVKAFVADAIASGKMGALAVHCYLEGKDIREGVSGTIRSAIGPPSLFSMSSIRRPYPIDLKKVVPYDQINTLCFQHGARNEQSRRAGTQRKRQEL